MQSGNLAQSADCTVQTACHAVCRLRGHRFNGVLWRDSFKENRENCHDFIVYCVRNWGGGGGGISVVENLVRHNNRSFRANKLVIVSPNNKQENE